LKILKNTIIVSIWIQDSAIKILSH